MNDTVMSGILRILHVFRAPVGGLFRHVLDVAHGQIEQGHQVGIFCDETTGGAWAEKAFDALRPTLALGVTRVSMRRQIHPTDAMALAGLSQLCRSSLPNVLHGHGSKGGVFARLVPSPLIDGLPAVRAYTPHGGSFNYKPGSLMHRVYMRAEAIMAKRTDVFLFESSFVKQRFVSYVGQPDAPAPVVHNGLAEAEFAPIRHGPDPYDLLYIGELRSAKGIDTLLEALAHLRREHGRSLTLHLVGSGPDEALLRQHVRDIGIADAVAFSPARPIRAALESARIMVVPSRAESLPYVILEAAAAAQPLVSTNVGGIPEIFGPHGADLVPPGDPRRLAAAILAKCDESEAERSEKAERLRSFVQSDFRIDRMVSGALEGYRHGFRRVTRTHGSRPSR